MILGAAAPSAARVQVVAVVDASAAMAARDRGRGRLTWLGALAGGLRPGDQLSLVTYGSGVDWREGPVALHNGGRDAFTDALPPLGASGHTPPAAALAAVHRWWGTPPGPVWVILLHAPGEPVPHSLPGAHLVSLTWTGPRAVWQLAGRALARVDGLTLLAGAGGRRWPHGVAWAVALGPDVRWSGRAPVGPALVLQHPPAGSWPLRHLRALLVPAWAARASEPEATGQGLPLGPPVLRREAGLAAAIVLGAAVAFGRRLWRRAAPRLEVRPLGSEGGATRELVLTSRRLSLDGRRLVGLLPSRARAIAVVERCPEGYRVVAAWPRHLYGPDLTPRRQAVLEENRWLRLGEWELRLVPAQTAGRHRARRDRA